MLCWDLKGQTLQEWVAAAEPGSSLLLPSSDYPLDGKPLVIDKPLMISGSGRTRIRQESAVNAIEVRSSQVTLRDVTVHSGGQALLVSSSTSCKILGCDFRNGSGAAVYLVASAGSMIFGASLAGRLVVNVSPGVIVSACAFSGISAAGAAAVDITTSRGVRISDCNFEATGNISATGIRGSAVDGLYVGPNCWGGKIDPLVSIDPSVPSPGIFVAPQQVTAPVGSPRGTLKLPPDAACWLQDQGGSFSGIAIGGGASLRYDKVSGTFQGLKPGTSTWKSLRWL